MLSGAATIEVAMGVEGNTYGAIHMIPPRVLITGATGFVGCRLARVLSDSGVQVTGIVRSWHKAARVARLPITLAPGDVSDRRSLTDAMQGCDTVVHCALDTGVD